MSENRSPGYEVHLFQCQGVNAEEVSVAVARLVGYVALMGNAVLVKKIGGAVPHSHGRQGTQGRHIERRLHQCPIMGCPSRDIWMSDSEYLSVLLMP